ncbi:hypothetical protein, partial [Streptomyces lunaelactis]|uniref:hypothetical protein n=1 Tax=Streptomyces lunaelactis TaxID=1535768 RepID=UPI001C2F78E6
MGKVEIDRIGRKIERKIVVEGIELNKRKGGNSLGYLGLSAAECGLQPLDVLPGQVPRRLVVAG